MSDEHARKTKEQEPEVDGRLLAFADKLRSSQDHEAEEERPEVWVSFILAGRPYALPVTHVREYAPVGKITAVPGAPSVVCGVASLRGHAIPVVDLRTALGLADEAPESSDRVLVAEQRGRAIGLLIDRIGSVVKLLPSQIKAPPQGRDSESQKILGSYDIDDSTLALLSAETFLDQRDESR